MEKEVLKQQLFELIEFLEKRVASVQDYVEYASRFLRIMKNYLHDDPNEVLSYKPTEELLADINYFIQEYMSYFGFGYDFVWAVEDFARYLSQEEETR